MLKRIEISRDKDYVHFINEGNDLRHLCYILDWEIYQLKWAIIRGENTEKNVDKLVSLAYENGSRHSDW